MSGLCTEGRAMYVSPTNQIEASMLLTISEIYTKRFKTPFLNGNCKYDLYINIFGEKVFRNENFYWWVLWKYQLRSLKPVKMLPWGRTSQRWFTEVVIPTVRAWRYWQIKGSPHSQDQLVVPLCFTLLCAGLWSKELKLRSDLLLDFILWKYEPKSWNQWNCQLDVKWTSASFAGFSKLRFGWRVSWYFSVDINDSEYFHRWVLKLTCFRCQLM